MLHCLKIRLIDDRLTEIESALGDRAFFRFGIHGLAAR
jgi:hypothetical protein